jgi:hypothetical protein
MTTLGVSFIMFSQQFRGSMRTEVLQDQHAGHDVKKQLDTVILKLIRDEPATNFTSSMYGSSFLEDMYGSEFPNFASLTSTLANSAPAPFPTNGPAWVNDGSPPTRTLFYIPLAQNGNGTFDCDGNGNGFFSQLAMDGFYNGLVLTVRSGERAGQSTRILSFATAGAGLPSRLIVKGFDIPANAANAPPFTIGDTFCINGRPFNGTGAGFGQVVDANNNFQNFDPGPTHTTEAQIRPAVLPGAAPALHPNDIMPNAPNRTLPPTVVVGPAAPNTLLQNYATFSGISSAFGNPPTAVVIPMALLPNYTVPAARLVQGDSHRDTGKRDYGGMDEGYDAPDLQNMFLGHIQTNNTGGVLSVLPSFHRPELISYLTNSGPPANPANDILNPPLLTPGTIAIRNKLWRSIMLRPYGYDHPKFTGSNPSFNRINGPWDVDNDGDGIADSIWIDVGLPIQTLPDGKKVKPLAAILCLDMDGRLNLNAHGSYSQAVAAYSAATRGLVASFQAPGSSGPTITPGDFQNVPSNWLLTSGTGTTDANRQTELLAMLGQLPLGEGYGVAEISLASLFPTGPGYQQFLAGVTTTTPFIEGRYGELNSGYSLSNFSYDPLNGFPKAGVTQWYAGGGSYTNMSPSDRLGAIEQYHTPGSAQTAVNWYGDHQRAWDYWGRGVTAVDLSGNLLHIEIGKNNAGNKVNWQSMWAGTNADYDLNIANNPYLLNLAARKIRNASTVAQMAMSNPTLGADNPFSVSEFERLLRLYDYDANTLPERLGGPNNRGLLATAGANLSSIRNIVTTESADVPCPTIKPSARMIQWANTMMSAGTTRVAPLYIGDGSGICERTLRGQVTVLDVLCYRLQLGAVPVASLVTTANNMLPPEIVAGLRFDLSRPFGNATDNNANGVVNEPGEPQNATAVWRNGFSAAGVNWPTTFDTRLQRQLFAKYLYILAMLSMEERFTDLFPNDTSATFTPTLRTEMTSRRIAQWAVNCVDYRDSDAIMTPFEYDANPFNGWDVDDDVSSYWGYSAGTVLFGSETPPDYTREHGDTHSPARTDRRVVWGCEKPELLISETLATHDFRIADTTKDTTGKSTQSGSSPDDDPDQIRIPQGSLFVELFCPRSTNGAEQLPAELYNGGNLILSATAPGGAPVWRMVVVRNPVPGGVAFDLQAILSANPTLTEMEIDPTDTALRTNVTVPGAPPGFTFNVERIIWMSTTLPVAGTTQKWERIYYNHDNTGPVAIAPGGYAVVGPRVETHFGRVLTGNPPSLPATSVADSPQRIMLLQGGAKSALYFDQTGTQVPANAAGINFARSIVCAGLPMSGKVGWAGTANFANASVAMGGPAWSAGSPQQADGVGISVSEPLWSTTQYYTEPSFTDAPLTIMDSYAKYNTGGFPDLPLDFANKVLNAADLNVGTHFGFAGLILQRLANPLIAWQPDPTVALYNPYITVDYSSIDLVKFNGEEQTHLPASPAPNDKLVWDNTNSGNYGMPVAPGLASSPMYFNSHQRGALAPTVATKATVSIYSPYTHFAPGTAGPAATNSATLVFSFPVNMSLGFLNPILNTDLTTTKANSGTPLGAAASGGTETAPSQYTGAPNPVATAANGNTFPALNWPNRPFVSSGELMMVPASAPSRIGLEFGEQYVSIESTTGKPSEFVTPGAGTIRRLSHLLNFFWTEGDDSTAVPVAPQLSRLLEFVHVPTRFVGFNEWMNPVTGTGLGGLAPPFNYIPSYREPGRVNINTIADERVWCGLIHGQLTNPAAIPPVVGNPNSFTLPGYSAATTPALAPARTDLNTIRLETTTPFPDRSFAHVFRGAYGADYETIPPNSVVINPPHTTPNIANGTLLRADPAGAPTPTPWLQYGTTAYPTSTPLVSSLESMRVTNPQRNPYFAFQNYQRMSNLVTTRSNVFAVWVTVGYFEVEPVTQQKIAELNGAYDTQTPPQLIDTVSTVYPDGYMLGQELGAETGEFTRHRGFYIIDRTIPVGYVRGEDINVEKTILLRRIIQ